MTILGAEAVVITRRSATLSGGVIGISEGATEAAVASIQPVPGDVLESLPERSRSRAQWIAYFDEAQPAVNMTATGSRDVPDLLTRASGATYEIHGIADWTSHVDGLPNRAYVLQAVGVDE
jgi:hypothetical protein